MIYVAITLAAVIVVYYRAIEGKGFWFKCSAGWLLGHIVAEFILSLSK